MSRRVNLGGGGAGEVGPTGPQGEPGPAGPTGATGPAGPLLSRTTANATTSSLAAGASDSTTTITMAVGFRLLAIQTSRPARVRLYNTTAARTADLARAVATDPTSDAGVILDHVTTDTAVHNLSPLVDGVNTETVPVTTIAMTVTNNDVSTGTVTVTLTYIRTE